MIEKLKLKENLKAAKSCMKNGRWNIVQEWLESAFQRDADQLRNQQV